MPNTKIFIILSFVICLISCTESPNHVSSEDEETIVEPTNRVVLSSEIQWEKLNPARGDQSPQAGTIWGNRQGEEATGFLAKFVDGFSSPPHIHNVTYRAMVIKGLIHNDDPKADKMWMPKGSFWTQPAGEPHITAAKGEENIAYVEIDNGPYLVKPISEAFDNGERPINVDKSNIIWLDGSQMPIIDVKQADANPAIAFLWEDENHSGYLLKLPNGFKGNIKTDGEAFHAVVITGTANYPMPQSDDVKSLDPGSYFTSNGKAEHQIEVNGQSEVIIYIRTNGNIRIVS